MSLRRIHSEPRVIGENVAEWMFTERFRVDGYELFDGEGESIFYRTVNESVNVLPGDVYLLRISNDGLMEDGLTELGRLHQATVRLFQYTWGEEEERLLQRKRNRRKTWKVDWSINGF